MGKNKKSKNKYRRFLSFLIALCLTAGLVLLMSIPVNANPGGGGSGTAADPWLISDIVQLRTFRDNVNSGTNYANQHIRLTADITLTGTNNWTAPAAAFSGTFCGSGFTISGLHNNNVNAQHGFFGSLGGVVQNLNLTNVNFTGSSSNTTGGIARTNNGIIQNCYVQGTISTTDTTVGGITGNNNINGRIWDCHVNVNVTGTDIVGGIVGTNNGEILRCYAQGTVHANGIFTWARAGGIAGQNNSAASRLENCAAFNTSVTSTANTSANGPQAGRILAISWNNSILNGNRAIAMTLQNGNGPITPTSSLTGVDGATITTSIANSAIYSGWSTAIWNIPSGSYNGTLPAFRTYRVSYNANGGSGTMTDTHGYRGQASVLANTFTRTGHTFNGWNTAANGSGINRAPGSTFTISVDTTLWAQWNIVTPTAAAATNYGKTYFTANWNNTGADSYLLDIATDSNFTNMVTGYSGLSVSSTSQAITGLTPDTEYFYRIRAVSGSNISENSNTVSVKTASVNREAIINDQTTKFSVGSENLQYILDYHIVTDEDIANNNSITLTLTVNETDDLATGAESIIELSQGRLLQFFDITIEKSINNGTPVKLSELSVPVKITIDLSPELSGKSGYTVYRYHNGVQRIGTDTDTDEFFTVSRGLGENNVDQVIIHTRNFSTFAVVENIVTLDGLGSDDFDVQARIVDNREAVYRIDIAWGDMRFIYSPEEFTGTWNPDTMQYEGAISAGWHGMHDFNNRIRVSNHSNADVLVSFAVANIEFADDVDMSVLKTNDEDGDAAINMPLGKVPVSGAAESEIDFIEAYLRLSGSPSAADIELLTAADVWHKIGIITVTITPDGGTLTPLR